ncbi:hypothetical protein [Bacillus atrophaeus]
MSLSPSIPSLGDTAMPVLTEVINWRCSIKYISSVTVWCLSK